MLPCPSLLKGSFLKEPLIFVAPKRVFPGSVAWASYDDIGLVKNETSLCGYYKQPLTTCFGVVARQSCLSGVSPRSYGSQIVFSKPFVSHHVSGAGALANVSPLPRPRQVGGAWSCESKTNFDENACCLRCWWSGCPNNRQLGLSSQRLFVGNPWHSK